jgi:hypothetical protein
VYPAEVSGQSYLIEKDKIAGCLTPGRKGRSPGQTDGRVLKWIMAEITSITRNISVFWEPKTSVFRGFLAPASPGTQRGFSKALFLINYS